MSLFRIPWLSDIHLATANLEAQEFSPRRLARMRPHEAQRYLDLWTRENRRAFRTASNYLKEMSTRLGGLFPLIGLGGDIISGHQEKGCYHPTMQPLLHEANNMVKLYADDIALTGGNHESGYGWPRSMTGGLTFESLVAQREIFGPLWWKKEVGSLAIVGVCSPLAGCNGADPNVYQLKREQEQFVGDTLASLPRDRPWLFATHDMSGCIDLEKQLRSRVSSVCGMVSGDLHSPFLHNLVRGLLQVRHVMRSTSLTFLKKSIFCPSLAPGFWPGYGMLMLSWDDTKQTLQSETIALKRPIDSERVPTQTPIKAIWWLL
jgi:hypothetical protein